MKIIPIEIEKTYRLLNALFLVLGIIFSTVGLENRTVGSIFLWLSIAISLCSLVTALRTRGSWYSSIFFIIATYIFMLSKYSPYRFFNLFALIFGLLVSLGALSGGTINKRYSIKKK